MVVIMKFGKLSAAASVLWNSVNTNFGSAVLVAGAAYAVGTGQREEELRIANNSLATYKESNEELNLHLHKVNHTGTELLAKNQVLQRENQQLRSESQSCKMHLAFTEYAFKNSYCFFKQAVAVQPTTTDSVSLSKGFK